MYLISSKVFRIGSKCNFTPFVDFVRIPVRNLFSRVTQFERLRNDAVGHFKSADDIEQHKKKFIDNFSMENLDVKRDKLKEYILLIDKTDELRTLKSILVEYHHEYNNSIHQTKKFIFGTEIMRMFYLLNLPDKAIEFFEDADLKKVFEQIQTCKVMLYLLYENKRYADVFRLYEKIRERLDLYELFPDITVNCLVFGACYHLNTPEHLKYAQDLWKRTKNVKQLTRSRYFLAELALKQNQPKFALGLVLANNLYVTVRFIQLMAHTKSGNFDQACDILRRSIDSYKLNPSVKPKFGQQMIEDLREAIKTSGAEVHIIEFSSTYEELKSLDLISDETLDQHLCATFPPMLPKNVFLKIKRRVTKTN